MKKSLKVKARAKINIILDILGKRDDGYHEIKTITQTLDLSDTITVSKNESGIITISTNSGKIPSDSSNLAYRAAECLKKKYNINGGIAIEIDKNIPVAAGLAGGSADCASTLIAVRNLYNLPITDSELAEIGKYIGADVPYCIYGGTYLAEGIGEKLTKLSPFPMINVLIAKPSIDVSTAWVYKNFNLSKVREFPDADKMIKYIEENDIQGICGNLRNVLESVTAEKYPIIDDIKKAMIKFGALGALMSGSGPTVFGLYTEKKECESAFNYLREELGILECFITSISYN